ncbi:MAG: Rieske (2Fe-2S) protein, partial [Acidianus sp.]|uniref:Rieske (2Fe-2S) protein n=1 Tax=Acidianus sp. TaxID=1872104 RepID=UPI0039790452
MTKMPTQQKIVIKKDEIPPMSMVEYYFPAQKPWERKPVLVINYKGSIFAIEAFCSHAGLSLEDGFLTDDGKVVCPWHGSVFDIKTGKVVDGPAKRDLKT